MFKSIRKWFQSEPSASATMSPKLCLSAAQATVLTEQARQNSERELLESVLDAVNHYAGRGLNSVSVTRPSGPPYDPKSVQTVLARLALLGYTARFSDNAFTVEWNAKT